ncbi:hypothetical protein BAX99_06200 [Elizabethkingia miricola]|nr:hypothetical protein BAX99_06200 [Elizabethkingia miricola]
MREREDERHLASKLGLTYIELCQLNYVIEVDKNENNVIYNYRIVFNTRNPNLILNKIQGLSTNNTIFMSPWDFDDNHEYTEEFEAIIENSEYLNSFNEKIENIEKLIKIETLSPTTKEILHNQIYISIISTVETFLSNSFINLTFESREYFKNFIETHPDFRNQKFELREIYRKQEKLEEIAQKVMLDTIYHNLPVVRNMFQDTFKITFPDISNLHKAVLTRHDLVHRNGYTKERKKVLINEPIIKKLIRDVKDFIHKLSIELKLYEQN